MRAYELIEGVYDPHIFKAIIMAGPPGSGKSTVAKKLTGGSGLKMVDSDSFLKLGVNDHTQRAKLSSTQLDNYIEGRLGVVIDGTGHNVNRILETKRLLDFHGYDTILVFVDVDLENALSRNTRRSRTENPQYVSKMWNEMEARKEQLRSVFGGNMVVVDNRPGVQNDWNRGWKVIKKWLDRDVNTPYAQDWKREQQQKKSLGEDYKRLKRKSTEKFRELYELSLMDGNDIDIDGFYRDAYPSIFFTEDFDDESLHDAISPWIIDVDKPTFVVDIFYMGALNRLQIDIDNYKSSPYNMQPTIESKNIAHLHFDNVKELRSFIVLMKTQFDGDYNLTIDDRRNKLNEDLDSSLNPIAMNQADAGKVVEKIKKECGQYLGMIDPKKHHLFRGLKLRNYFDAMEIPGTRENRKALDTSNDVNNVVIKAINENGLVANRNNSWFSTGDIDRADFYGTVYVAFPTDGFHYTWSSDIDDLYSFSLQNAEDGLPINKIYELAKRSYQGDDGSLSKAIEFGHEIMFTSPKVILVDEKFHYDYIKDQL